uniref:RRM domain-containing protein n=1 Tax=Polytomella parva TaxID=51329 RepID=A0A7S0YK04_9CHLO|eukprot:CAMPEP_0175045036 /NCGR_PEP_ID=MMETSP0052_2-20121109/4168_1 /TAXON_ID=51329 ORGANISM="Polytomella parva, Strain SAG 63-3" /NCGR_SAMPLE_ID=MMETSP0052_2 /ASSEMBLY_ACC=CAM_ASM_000194 /LENGTH=515 /DNA_ID=CAMNT_0016308459 /DNA_START=14 /DNA_END=1561 /DNA_ORIENTATION=-
MDCTRKRSRDMEDEVRKVFVAGLPYEMDWDELKRVFMSAGTVTFAKIFKDKDRGVSKGNGVVEFSSTEEAVNAVKMFDGQQVSGRLIHVKLDEHPERQPKRVIGGANPNNFNGTNISDIGGYGSMSGGATTFSKMPSSHMAPPTHIMGDISGINSMSMGGMPMMAMINGMRGMTGMSEMGNFMNMGNFAMEPNINVNVAQSRLGQGRRLYVTNLAYEASWQQLKDHFKMIGPVVHCSIIKDHSTGRSKGCGLVEFEQPRDASNALKQLNGTNFLGRPLQIREDLREAQENGNMNINAMGGGGGPHCNGSVNMMPMANNPYISMIPNLSNMMTSAGPVDGRGVGQGQVNVNAHGVNFGAGNPHMHGTNMYMMASHQQQHPLQHTNNNNSNKANTAHLSNNGMGGYVAIRPGMAGNRTFDHSRLAVRRDIPVEQRRECQIVIHGLPYSYDAANLRDMVKMMGVVVDCHVHRDRMTRKSKGYGTVTFDCAEAAQRAIEKLNGHDLHGRSISVRLDSHL